MALAEIVCVYNYEFSITSANIVPHRNLNSCTIRGNVNYIIIYCYPNATRGPSRVP